MAGGNFILSGLLSGLGRGMEQDFLARREEALLKLREQQKVEGEARAEQALIRQEYRAEKRDIAKEGRQSDLAIQKLRVAGEETRTTNDQKFGQEIQLTKIKATEDRSTEAFKAKLDRDLATMKAELDRSNDEASQRLKAELDSGDIKDRVTDANGRVILIRNDGRMVTTPFTEKEKVDTSSYGRRERQRGPTPGNFDPESNAASSNSGEDGPWYSPGAKSAGSGERVATQAQVREAAKQRGMTEAQVRDWMRKNGWSVR